MVNEMETINKYKGIITLAIVVAAGAFAFYNLEATASSNAKKIDRVEQSIVLLTEIVRDDHGKLEGFLIGININPDTARIWAAYPKAQPQDSAGNPIYYVPWVEIGEGVQYGIKHELVKDSDGETELTGKTLWDLRKKK